MTTKMESGQAAALIQQIIHDYIGLQSWFYQQQIDPYLPQLSTHILNEFAKHGVSLTTPDKK